MARRARRNKDQGAQERRSIADAQLALFRGSQAGAGRRFGMSKVLTKGESKRGEARVWLQGRWLEDVGYDEGAPYKVRLDPITHEVTLYLVSKGTPKARHVSRQRSAPLIELTSSALTEVLLGAERVIVETDQGQIIIRPASVPRMIADRSINGLEGSIFTGAGFLSEAAVLAGYEAAWGVEIEERNASIYAANHPRAVPIQLPVEEAVMLNWQLHGLGRPLLSQVELLTGGVPCQPFSKLYTGKKKEGSDEYRQPKDHELIAMTHWFLSVVQQVNPLNVLVEQVEYYLNSESFAVLSSALSVMGYFVRSKVIDSHDLGSLAGRRRAVVVATTAPDYDWPQNEPPRHTVGQVLYSPDQIDRMTAEGRFGRTDADGGVSKTGAKQKHPKTMGAWFSLHDPAGTKAKSYGPGASLRRWWARPKFEPSIITTGTAQVSGTTAPACGTTRIGAVTKGYHNLQPENPYVAHPANTGTPKRPARGDLYRFLTVDEIRRLHGVPDSYVLPDSYKDAVEVLGQGVIVDAFEKVIERLPRNKGALVNPPPWALSLEPTVGPFLIPWR